jgi:hypothetical protein
LPVSQSQPVKRPRVLPVEVRPVVMVTGVDHLDVAVVAAVVAEAVVVVLVNVR